MENSAIPHENIPSAMGAYVVTKMIQNSKQQIISNDKVGAFVFSGGKKGMEDKTKGTNTNYNSLLK